LPAQLFPGTGATGQQGLNFSVPHSLHLTTLKSVILKEMEIKDNSLQLPQDLLAVPFIYLNTCTVVLSTELEHIHRWIITRGRFGPLFAEQIK